MYTIEVDITRQAMMVFSDNEIIKKYLVSTAANGAGEIKNSFQTPRGRHVIRAKIGAGEPANSVFVQRRPTGEIYSLPMREQFPNRDWILTRIFWLSGLDVGVNRLGNVDTMQRFIYIHGTPDDVVLGKPGSRGCIRMRNSDILELFDLIPVGTKIIIR